MSDPAPPALPWSEVVDRLEHFFANHDVEEPNDAEVAIRSAAAADPGARLAALDHFRQVFTEVEGRDFDPREHGSPVAWNGLAALVLEVSPDERQRFFHEVLFDVALPATYDSLADVIRLLVPLDELVAGIVDRLGNGSDRQQANALAMQYSLWGRSRDQRLGDARRRRIAQALERLREAGSVGPLTAAELRGYTIPEDAAR